MIQASKIEIGKDVRAICTKCKAETVHVITKIVAGQIKKVFCKACNSTHMYKTPETIKKAAAKKPTRTGSTGIRRSRNWSTLISAVSEEQIVDYSIREDYTKVEAIRHKDFGVGVVIKVFDDNKIEVVFEQESKVLVHNWQPA